jgi:hypothetical protein
VASVAGLERSARLAGESFGYEDVRVLPVRAESGSRWLWWLAALAAAIGLAVLHFS